MASSLNSTRSQLKTAILIPFSESQEKLLTPHQILNPLFYSNMVFLTQLMLGSWTGPMLLQPSSYLKLVMTSGSVTPEETSTAMSTQLWTPRVMTTGSLTGKTWVTRISLLSWNTSEAPPDTKRLLTLDTARELPNYSMDLLTMKTTSLSTSVCSLLSDQCSSWLTASQTCSISSLNMTPSLLIPVSCSTSMTCSQQTGLTLELWSLSVAPSQRSVNSVFTFSVTKIRILMTQPDWMTMLEAIFQQVRHFRVWCITPSWSRANSSSTMTMGNLETRRSTDKTNHPLLTFRVLKVTSLLVCLLAKKMNLQIPLITNGLTARCKMLSFSITNMS